MVSTRRLSNTKGKGRIKKKGRQRIPYNSLKKKTLKTKRKTTWKKEIQYQGISYVLGEKTPPKSVVLNELKTTMADHLELLSFPIHQIK